MATKKRPDLIDRQELIKAVQKKHFAIADNTHPYEAIRIQGKYFREVVDNAPTVDAVEVVYCQDCARCKKGFCTIRKDSWGATLKVGLHDFCSDGERRTNG